jgi:MFS family permease
MSVSVTAPARRLSSPLDFALVAGIVSLALFASATPSPLYADYAADWGFSTPVLTAVYAVYAIGVLTALLLIGRLSDEIGRRPVLIGSLIALLVATGLFMAARSVEWLFAARAVQGVATGAALGAAGAAMLDLHPRGDAAQTGLINGVGSALGLGFGAAVSALLVQEAPDPRVTPFLLVFVLFLIALAGTMRLSEPVARIGELRLRPQWPSVPRSIRPEFALASLGVIASWSIGGLYLSLSPSFATELFDTHSHLAGGAAVLAMAGPGGLAQLVFRGLAPRAAMFWGSLVLAGGMAATVATLSTGSPGLFLGASALTGIGFGVAFMGAMRLISTVAPPQQRASVMSAFYVVAYLSLSVPTLIAGMAVPGLGLERTFRIFGSIVVALGLATAVGSRFIRSRQDRPASLRADVPRERADAADLGRAVDA